LKTRSLPRALLLFSLLFFVLNSLPSLSVAKAATLPLAAFTYNPCVACAVLGDVVFFNANTSLGTNGPIVSYTWNFGDGSPLAKTNSSYQTHDYVITSPGQWKVALTVQDNNGLTDTISQLVLFNVAPDFTIRPPHPLVGQPVTFNASTTRVYQDTIPPTQGFLWNFGDGNNGTGVIAVHEYQATGPYRVLLTVVTSQGDPTISKILTVKPPPQGAQQIQASFDNVNVTVFAIIAVDSTTRTVMGTISVVATNTTTGTIIFSKTFNFTITSGLSNNLRFLVAINTTSPQLAVSCTINSNTTQLNCFVSRDPDINGNGTVDIVDFSVAALDYGATLGSAQYNTAVDLDNNGLIDIVDLAIMGADYGAPIY
jgi:PKD repeat protein